MKRWSTVSMVGLVALPLVLCGAGRGGEKTADGPLVLPVNPVVEVEDFQTREYPGSVVAVARVDLIPQVSGEILELGFKNGEVVKVGQLLYRLDSVKYEAAVKNAEAKVAEYRARITYAESNYQRNKTLSDVNAVSQDAMESSGSTLNAYRASLAAAEAELVAAQDDLAHCRIVAPVSGKISSTNFTEGNYVTPNTGTLATIIQSRPIRVRFAMSNRDLLTLFGNTDNLCRNGVAKLTLANGKEYAETGGVEYVENEAELETDSLQVFALFQNSDRGLITSSTVRVTLSNRVGVRRPAVIPTAIMQDIKGTYVWVVGNDGRASKRYIHRGNIVNDMLLVESGLELGEQVVTDGTHKVSPGDLIQAAKVGEK